MLCPSPARQCYCSKLGPPSSTEAEIQIYGQISLMKHTGMVCTVVCAYFIEAPVDGYHGSTDNRTTESSEHLLTTCHGFKITHMEEHVLVTIFQGHTRQPNFLAMSLTQVPGKQQTSLRVGSVQSTGPSATLKEVTYHYNPSFLPHPVIQMFF